MTFKPMALVLAGAALLGLSQQATAQTVCTGNPCSLTNTVSATVSAQLKLTISSATTTLTSPDTTAFNQGYQDDPSVLSTTVKANTGWSLNVKAAAATWTGSGGARANKPAGDLQWSKTGGAPYTALTTSNAQVATSGSGTSGTTTTISYRTAWDYTLDTPGTYQLGVVFTLSAP
jgi:hypothetical protein